MFKKKATLDNLSQVKTILGARINSLEKELESQRESFERQIDTLKHELEMATRKPKTSFKSFEIAYCYKYHDEQGKSHSQTRYIVVSANDENDAIKEFALSRCEGKILAIQRINVNDLKKKPMPKAKIVKKLEPSENQRPWEEDL